MKSPWMKLYIGDYLADTRHLTAEEHGAYLLLIMHLFRTGEIPSSEKQKAEIASTTARRWPKVRYTIERFFVALPDGSWTHVRVQKEVRQLELISQKRARYGSKGGLKKHKNFLAKATHLLQQNPSYQISESEVEEVESHSSPVLPFLPDSSKRTHTCHSGEKRIAYDAEFERLWREYPKREGANPKALAFKKFKAVLKAGVPLEAIAAGVKAHRKDCDSRKATGTPYVPMMSTWLNQQRWGDYGSEQQPKPKQPPTAEQLADRERFIKLGEKLNGQGNQRSSQTGVVCDGAQSWFGKRELS